MPERPQLYQHINKRGIILHLTPALKGLCKGNGHLGATVLNIARTQRSLGYDARVILPGSPDIRDDITPLESTPQRRTFKIEDVPAYVLGEHFSSAFPQGSTAIRENLVFSNSLWGFIDRELNQEKPTALLVAHDYVMGTSVAQRPEGSAVKTIFVLYDPNKFDNRPLPPISDPEVAGLLAGSQIGGFFMGGLSGIKIGVWGADRTAFWSDAHRALLMRGIYGRFIEHEESRGVKFIELGREWYPDISPDVPSSTIARLDLEFHNLVLGDSGLKFAREILAADIEKADALLYIVQEAGMSKLFGRKERALKEFDKDTRSRQSALQLRGLGRGMDPEFPDTYTGALGTMVFLIGEGAKSCTKTTPIFFGINDAGKATRETPITQQERGSKGSVVVGNRTLNQIVAVEMDLIAKQLPEGEWVIVGASDNVFAGRITVGNHLLSEDRHGIINLTLPYRVLGEGITAGDEKLKPLEQLGILLVDPFTGARKGFREKIPVTLIQDLAQETEGIVDMNSMIKIIRRDVAALFTDNEHYLRPSFKDGKPLLESYAKQKPDWSKLFDEPSVLPITLKKWMKLYDVDVYKLPEETIEALKGVQGLSYEEGATIIRITGTIGKSDREKILKTVPKSNEGLTNKFKRAFEQSEWDIRDWRLLWIVANDIVLSSLESIALSNKYFGKFASENLDWKSINDATLNILKEFSGFRGGEDAQPTDWYFKRNGGASLIDNWKELFLAYAAIRYGSTRINEDKVKDEWMKRKPDGIDYDQWRSILETAIKLDKNENGIAAGRIDGFWLDTGTKRELFNAWMELINNDSTRRDVARILTNVVRGGAVEANVKGQEYINITDRTSVHIGGSTRFLSTRGGKIIIGSNVVIRDSVIIWDGEGDLRIPNNTVIYDSELRDIDPTVAGDGATLVYRFNNQSGQTFEIDTHMGKKRIKFGFYSGVMFGTLKLSDGRELSTIFPLDINIKDKPDISLIRKYVENSDLAHHFEHYYEGRKDVLSTEVPFTGMLADDILKNIGF